MLPWSFALLVFLYGGLVQPACIDETPPSNQVEGCTWNADNSSGCAVFRINCSSSATIDKGCLLGSETGPCSAKSTKFYYDVRNGKCSPFIYGGCSGNDNRFESLAECQSVCINLNARKKTQKISLLSTATLNCTGENEEPVTCGACDQYCDTSKAQVCSALCRDTECGCRNGYIRNNKNVCVAPSQCTAEDVEGVKGAETTKTPTTYTTTSSTASTTTTPTTTTTTTTSTTTTTTTTTSTTTASTTTSPTPPTTPALASAMMSMHNTVPENSVPPSKPPTTVWLNPDTFTPTTLELLLTQTNIFKRSTPNTDATGSTNNILDICSRIKCPSYAKCWDGECVTQSSSNCSNLRLALPPEGCQYSYAMQTDGCQTPALQCSDLECGRNEEVKPCGACDPTCGAPVCVTSAECLSRACGCVRGFVRNPRGVCVERSECQARRVNQKRQQSQ